MTTTARVAVECPACHGHGEIPTPGTYGPTTSPEALEVTTCRMCGGDRELPVANLADFEGVTP